MTAPVTLDARLRSLAPIGFGLAILFGSVQFWMLGIGTEDLSGSVLTRALARLAVYGTLAVCLLLLRNPVRDLSGPTLVPLWLFCVAICVAALFTESPLSELERTIWFSGFLLMTAAFARLVGWYSFLRTAAITGVVLVGAGIVGHLTGWTPAYETPFFDGAVLGIERARGLQAASNNFGRTASLLALVGLMLLLRRGFWQSQLLGLTSAVVGLGGLILSQSRVPTAALFIAVAIVISRRTRNLRFAAIPFGAVAIGLFYRVVSTGDIGVGARSELSSEADSFLGRTPIWAEAISVWSEHPFTGVGTESLQAHYSEWTDRGLSLWDPATAHNALLQTLAAHGMVAGALLVCVAVAGLVTMVRRGRTGSAELIVMVMIQSVTEAVFTGNPEFSIALLVGTLAVGARPSTQQDPATNSAISVPQPVS